MDYKEATALLKQRGITQAEYAESIGMSRQALWKRWKNGVSEDDRIQLLGVDKKKLYALADNYEEIKHYLKHKDDEVIAARLEQLRNE